MHIGYISISIVCDKLSSAKVSGQFDIMNSLQQ